MPNNIATTYFIVTKKTYESDYDGVHGVNEPNRIFYCDDINMTLIIPFTGVTMGNLSSMVNINSLLNVNVQTTNVLNNLIQLLNNFEQNNIVIQIRSDCGYPNANSIVNGPAGNPLIGQTAMSLAVLRMEIIQNTLSRSGVPLNSFINQGIQYNSQDAIVINIFANSNPSELNDWGLAPAILPILQNSGYTPPPIGRP